MVYVVNGGCAPGVVFGVAVGPGVAGAVVAEGAAVARASVWWRTRMLEVVERTTGGVRYAEAPSAMPERAPERRVGYSVTRSATAETTAMTGRARSSAWRV